MSDHTVLWILFGLLSVAFVAIQVAARCCGRCGRLVGHNPFVLHGDGVVDDTAALQALLDQRGGFLP